MLAEQARGQAEQLLAYLSDDFARELENFGRLEVLAEFSQRQIDYFHGLPQALRGADTVRNGALALVNHSRALRALGQLEVAGSNADEAVQLLRTLHDSAGRSEATTVGLARAYAAKARVLESRGDPTGMLTSEQAIAVLQPLLAAPKPPLAARRAYVEIATRLGYQQGAASHREDAARTLRSAMQAAADLGGRDIRDPEMGAWYAEAGGWLVTVLESLGQYPEAGRVSRECLAVADQVLERRPGYRLVLHAQQILVGVLVSVSKDELDPQAARQAAVRQEQVSLSLLNLDPNNVTSLNNMAVAVDQLADTLWQAGQLRESVAHRLREVDYARRAAAGGASFVSNYTGTLAGVSYFQAATGDHAGADAMLASAEPEVIKLRKTDPGGDGAVIAEGWLRVGAAYAALLRDDLAATRRIAAEAVRELEGITPHGELQFRKTFQLYFLHDADGRAAYLSGDAAAAEQSLLKAVEARTTAGTGGMDDRRQLGMLHTWLALAQARQGHTGQAAQTIAPAVKFQRELAARNRGDRWQPQELAAAVYAQALTDPADRTSLLNEAARLMDRLASEVRAT
ncbi:MAG TPA: hypothetical protein VI195_01115, partial [Steroidobacteraceae bacterium]